MRRLSLITATVGPVFPVPVYAQHNMLWLKHSQEKTAHYQNQKAPLPNLGNLPPGQEPRFYVVHIVHVSTRFLWLI